MRRLLLLCWVGLQAVACVAGAPADLGRDALLQVEGGTFWRRELPPRNGSGPSVLAAYLGRTDLRSGEQDKSFSGVLDEGANSVAIALAGDVGYWTVAAAYPLLEAPDNPSFNAALSFSLQVPVGPAELWLWAIDAEVNYGDAFGVDFRFVRAPAVAGELVVLLSWDTNSDLDLHVLTPQGVEISKDNVSSSTAGVADAGINIGRFDVDSNADCVIDGLRRENVAWEAPPPGGHYLVRVDTVSLCEAAIARWKVEVWLGGERWATAEGTSTAAATRQPHGHGAGVTALEFDVPER